MNLIEKYLGEKTNSVTAKNLKKGMDIHKFGKIDNISKQNHIIIVYSGKSKKTYDELESVTINEATMVPPGLSTKYTSYKSRPTRMQLQKELDKNISIGMSMGKARMDIEKRYKLKLTLNSKGTIVNIN